MKKINTQDVYIGSESTPNELYLMSGISIKKQYLYCFTRAELEALLEKTWHSSMLKEYEYNVYVNFLDAVPEKWVSLPDRQTFIDNLFQPLPKPTK